MTYRRIRSAAGVLALLIGVSLAAAPPAGRAATVSCPDVQLLSEALAGSPSVFVGVVLTPFESDAGRGATLGVEETWRGPDLAPVVRVTVEDAAGAPTLDLARGVRYLVAADRPPDVASADAAVEQLTVRACSVTRAWSPELADLRPPDARLAEDPTPQPAGTAHPSAPGWLWAGSAVLLGAALGAAVVAFTRRRSLLPVTAVLGVAGIAVLGSAIVLSLNPQGSAATASPSPSTPMTTTSPEALSPDGRLVLRLEVMQSDDRRSAVVSVHADGRLISARTGGGVELLREGRLSVEGVRLVREAMAATGLLGADAPAGAEYVPEPLAEGGTIPVGVSRRLTFSVDGSSRVVRWTPIDPVDADEFVDAPEIERLEAFAQQMLTPDDWLPASAWVTADRSDYRAEAFHVLVRPIPFGSARPAIDIADLPAPLLASVGTSEPGAPLPGCVQLARSQATELLAMIATLFDEVSLTLAAASTDVAVDDAERSTSYHLSLRPLLPDEGGCPGDVAEPTETELAPGAIALVRVDALRVRSGAGSSFEIIDSFAAGDRVAVVAGPVAADGMDWYEVRQGPSGRGGHVARGPEDGDPWLVRISNGAIAFMEGDGASGRHSVGRMRADGSGIITLLDGGSAVWSPDGRRFAFATVQPDSTWQLATASPDGSQVSRLGEGENPIWSLDGSMIAFGRGDEIWVMNADGTEERLLVAGASPWSVAWDPDGSRLAYTAFEAPEDGGEGMFVSPEALWFVDIASGQTTQVTPAEVIGAGTQPTWSPDGTRLAYGGNRLIDASGNELMQLEIGVAWAQALWSPDGNELALMVDGSIEILELDSGERRTVARAGQANQLIWSPDGSHLAFTRSRAGSDGWQIVIVDADGGEPVAIGPAFAQFPAWQPVVSHGLD